jgi:hypothetical protein
MQSKKFTTSLAVGIALLASSAVPSYAATFTAYSAVLSGNPSLPSGSEISSFLNQVLQDPTVLDNPANVGFSNFQRDLQTNTTPVSSAISVSPLPGTTLSGSASSDTIYNPSAIALNTRTQSSLDPGTTANVNGAASGGLIADNIVVNSLSTPAGTSGFVRLGLSITGSGQVSPAGETSAGAVIAVGNQVFSTPNAITGNTEFVTNPVAINFGTPVDLKIGLGSAAGFPGNVPFVNFSGSTNFNAQLTSFQVTDANGNPLTDVTAISSSTGVDYVQAVPFSPSPTLGLLLLGGAWGVGSKLKKHNLLNKKDAA